MCGISGIAHWSNKSFYSTVARMSNSMIYRGPDSGYVKEIPDVCLGHRRLSIIDLSEHASQPMCDSSGRFWIVFNGEIYGFNNLKQELKKLGANFISSSDTEVVLEGYKKWGVKKLCQRLNGMFAFAIWDSLEKKLVLARDRFGEKPLYYLKFNNEVRFSSNINSLFYNLNLKKELDPDALVSYLHQGFCLPDYPILKHVKSIKPAHFLVFKKEKIIDEGLYWKPNFADKLNYSVESWINIIEKKLIEIVESELVSDVNTGALLSGGVDSSLICSIAAELNPNIDLFTVKMHDKSLDETYIAKKTASAIGGKHHIINADPIQFDDFISFQKRFSSPLGDSSALGMWLLSKEASKHVKVILTGDGGDELFAGYNTFDLFDKVKTYKKYIPEFINSIFLKHIANFLRPKHDIEYIRKFITFFDLINLPIMNSYIGRSFIPHNLNLFGTKLKSASNKKQYLKSLEKKWVNSSAIDFRDTMLEVGLHNSLLGDFIPKVDISSMSHSLEARTPFLHHQLADLAFMMPYNIKTIGGEKKGIVKKILQKRLGGNVSENIIKGKRGFVIPIDNWIDNKWSFILDELPNSDLVKEGFLNKSAIEKVINGYKLYPNSYSRLRYSLVTLHIWYKNLEI